MPVRFHRRKRREFFTGVDDEWSTCRIRKVGVEHLPY